MTLYSESGMKGNKLDSKIGLQVKYWYITMILNGVIGEKLQGP